MEWFHNKIFHGNFIGVHLAESKSKDSSYTNHVADIGIASEIDGLEDVGGQNGEGKVNGRGDASGKSWQQDGDWLCPNTRSVM